MKYLWTANKEPTPLGDSVANGLRLGMAVLCVATLVELLGSCEGQKAGAKETSGSAPIHEVGVVKAARKTLERQLVVSSELVPFQQIDVYAKESGFVKQLNVDYGTHVQAGQVMAVLEIPELQAQLRDRSQQPWVGRLRRRGRPDSQPA